MVRLKHQTVDVRSSPQEGADVVGKARGGEKLSKTGDAGGWAKVRLRDGTTGWIVKTFIDDFSEF